MPGRRSASRAVAMSDRIGSRSVSWPSRFRIIGGLASAVTGRISPRTVRAISSAAIEPALALIDVRVGLVADQGVGVARPSAGETLAWKSRVATIGRPGPSAARSRRSTSPSASG